MYALVEIGSTDFFRRKYLNNSFTLMPTGVSVKEVFAGLPKANKAFFQKATVLSSTYTVEFRFRGR